MLGTAMGKETSTSSNQTPRKRDLSVMYATIAVSTVTIAPAASDVIALLTSDWRISG
jgi:hypothetical protein